MSTDSNDHPEEEPEDRHDEFIDSFDPTASHSEKHTEEQVGAASPTNPTAAPTATETPRATFASEERSTKALQLSLQALEKSNDALEKSNEKLRSRLDSEWKYPKIAFGLVIALVAVNIIGNIVVQYFTLSGVDSVAKELRSQIAESKAAIVSAEQKFKDQQTELNSAKEEYQTTVDEAAKSLSDSIEATRIAHRILSLVNSGRDHLVYQQNPRQAGYYASEAQRILASHHERIKSQTNLTKALDELWPSVWVLNAQSGLSLDEMGVVKKAAEQLLGFNCDCLEGHYFDGLVKLEATFDAGSNEDDPLQGSIESLKKSIPPNQAGHPASLFLAAAYLHARQPDRTQKHGDRFLAAYPEHERSRLTGLLKTRIQVAQNLNHLAGIMSGEITPEAEESGCHPSESTGYLLAGEGRLIEHVIESVIVNRALLDLPDKHKSLFARAAVRVLLEVRRATCSPQPGGTFEDLLKKYGLVQEESKEIEKAPFAKPAKAVEAEVPPAPTVDPN